MSEGVLVASNVSKSFPGVKALADVSIRVARGSIHALLGENGAGKSTLIKIITGVYRPNSGTLTLEGKPLHFNGPRDAIAAGVGVVHQERNLIPRFSVGENIMLERLEGSFFRPIAFNDVHAQAKRWLDLLGLDLDPRTMVSRLSVAKMQMVEIAKALSLRSRVLLLDEPSASLTPHETIALFALLKKLRDDGVAIVFVSHKLEEVQELCDTVTVLRDGGNACDSQSMSGLGRQDLVRLMIGRNEQISAWRAHEESRATPELELRALSTEFGHSGINLKLHQGEILGLYGLVGAGRTELAKCLIGLHRVTGGELLIAGRKVEIGSVGEALGRYRIGYVSEDRKQEGLILMHSVLDNAGITIWTRLAGRFGFLTDRAVRVRRCAAHSEARRPHAVSQTSRRQSFRRQPAEGESRQMARGRRQDSDRRRADGRHRHQDEGLYPRASATDLRGRDRDPSDHERHARDDHAGRSDRGDGRVTGSKARSPTTGTTDG